MSLTTFVSLLRYEVARNLRMAGPYSAATVVVYRLGNYGHYGHGIAAWLAKTIARPLDAVYVKLLIGADIPPTLECGRGLLLAHGGRGIIINGLAKLGDSVTIGHRVTIGQSNDAAVAPVIGDRVTISFGAGVIGGVSIGDGATVGAHALVTRDVPPSHVAVGVPARSHPKPLAVAA